MSVQNPPGPAKPAVVDALRAALAAELDVLEGAAAVTREEVGSDETRSEGKYDTRSTEASYLARGQAFRIAALRQLQAWFEVFDASAPLSPPIVQVGALVGLVGHRRAHVFVAPAGGLDVDVGGTVVRVISPGSPLGAAMEELEEGDAFEVDSPRGVVTYEIDRLS